MDQVRDESALEQSALEQAAMADLEGQVLEACRHYLLLIANRELPTEVRQKVGASDMVQDTFAEAHHDLPRFLGQSEAQLRAWLRRILLNNVANARRHYQQTGKRDVAREIALGDAPSGEDWLALVPSRAASPSSEVVRHEDARLLEHALTRLPEHLRQVIVMRHRENKSFAEIGKAQGRTAAAARKSWVRGLEKLQRVLDKQDGE